MLPIVWLNDAIEDLSEIITYVADKNPEAAHRLMARIKEVPLPLSEHPYLYPPGRAPGTREAVATPNYIIVYRVTTHRIEIVNVVHARQEYPSAR